MVLSSHYEIYVGSIFGLYLRVPQRHIKRLEWEFVSSLYNFEKTNYNMTYKLQILLMNPLIKTLSIFFVRVMKYGITLITYFRAKFCPAILNNSTVERRVAFLLQINLHLRRSSYFLELIGDLITLTTNTDLSYNGNIIRCICLAWQ